MTSRRDEDLMAGLVDDLTPERIKAGVISGSSDKLGFGDLVAVLRTIMEWTPSELAKAAGLPRTLVLRLENGFVTNDEITDDVVEKLSRALKVDKRTMASKAPGASPAARSLALTSGGRASTFSGSPLIHLKHRGRQWAASVGDQLHTLVDALSPRFATDPSMADLTLGTGDGEPYPLKAGKQLFGTLEVSPAGIKVVFEEPAKDKTFTFRALWNGGRDYPFASIKVVPGQDWDCPIDQLQAELQDDFPDDFECVFEG